VNGGEAIAIKADVANQTDVERLFEETMKKFGSIDVVVHNSGIMSLSPIGKSRCQKSKTEPSTLTWNGGMPREPTATRPRSQAPAKQSTSHIPRRLQM
jgi:NAD(P)-dependent dehydrogenase (short-subunit alcohol dehydrogenase family)